MGGYLRRRQRPTPQFLISRTVLGRIAKIAEIAKIDNLNQKSTAAFGIRLSPQHIVSAAGGDDDQVHEQEHQVIMPAVGAVLAPEAGLPDEDLFLDCAEHD